MGPEAEETRNLLSEHRLVWQQKPVLQRIYREEFFSRLLSYRQQGGVSVEVGAGPGFLKEMLPEIISTDVIWCPWLSAVADAHHLPFKSDSVTNLMGLDVLHHLQAPLTFLKEAERVLAQSGRLILVEPWVTPFSHVVYRYLHQEDCELSARPLNGSQSTQEKKPFDGNSAIPYLLFCPRALTKTLAHIPSFKVVAIESFCLFAYLLSFGFKRTCLLPEALYPLVAKFERATLSLWRPWAALRVLLVLEKSLPQ